LNFSKNQVLSLPNSKCSWTDFCTKSRKIGKILDPSGRISVYFHRFIPVILSGLANREPLPVHLAEIHQICITKPLFLRWVVLPMNFKLTISNIIEIIISTVLDSLIIVGTKIFYAYRIIFPSYFRNMIERYL
jgi:hypothetical protein